MNRKLKECEAYESLSFTKITQEWLVKALPREKNEGSVREGNIRREYNKANDVGIFLNTTLRYSSMHL